MNDSSQFQISNVQAPQLCSECAKPCISMCPYCGLLCHQGYGLGQHD